MFAKGINNNNLKYKVLQRKINKMENNELFALLALKDLEIEKLQKEIDRLNTVIEREREFFTTENID